MEKDNDKISKIQTVKNLFHDERVQILIGLALIIVCTYLALSFVSFFFTGAADQSLIENLDLDLSEDIKAQVQNWTGYRGAVISNFFIANTFGVSCFFPVFFMIIWGLYIMLNSIKKETIKKYFVVSVFFLFWLSFFLSFLGAETSFFNLGGLCGKYETIWMESQIGGVGTFFFLMGSLLVFCLLTFDSTIHILKGEYNLTDKVNIKILQNFVRKIYGESVEKIEEEEKKEQEEPDDEENPDFGGDEDSPTESGEEQSNTNETIIAAAQVTNRDDADEKIEPQDKSNIVGIPQPVIFNSTQEEEPLQEQEPVKDDEKCKVITPQEDNVPYNPLEVQGPYDPTAELSAYKFPSIDLLEDRGPETATIDRDDIISKNNQIVEALKNFGIEIKNIEATVGPTVTLYEIVPAPGVKISRIKSLEDDIAMSLAALGIRIIAPVPGKGTVGIEVPNKNPQTVSMRSVICSKAFQESKAELPIAFGKTITNQVFTIDLAKAPHLLVAGATGQGKSVGLNALITSLLYKKHPSQLKFVMIDPKQVEFSIYSKIDKQYLAKLPGMKNAIITKQQDVQATLLSLTTEMENRYTLLTDVDSRNVIEYNNKFINRKIDPTREVEGGLHHRFLPYIVVIIDEYGDLIMTAGKEIETPIARIAQKARAVGIHMVIATQRPQVKIITGLIKANFPARLAFKVTSSMDSRTILEATGAQSLIGRGDMLYSSGSVGITRVQCAFIDTPEVEKITKFISNGPGYEEPYRLPDPVDETGKPIDSVPEVSYDVKALDPRLREAAELVVQSGNGSTSSLQRTLNLGFNRAGRIMDQLEGIGVVGAAHGSKPREVLVSDLEELEIIFRNLK